ncbi:coiled-coil domain-containing protein 142 [Dendrobates tinctorius]|uniref:coiled-coil domain-containing protein 142 n=1 Tax=Dendrobates tinctorius TaxID=92724 RepID=UPI003CC991C4
MSRRATPWSDPRHGPRKGFASSPPPPVLFRCDVISEGEELTSSVVGRDDASLQFLRQQRRLLTLSREFVVHQMRVLEYYKTVVWRPLSGLEAACLRLQQLCHDGAVLQRRVRANQLLRPLSAPVHQALRTMHRMLQLMSVKATIVAGEMVLSAVRCAARLPEEVPGGLSHTLTLYNKVIADVSTWASSGAEMLPISVTRSLEIVAEERAWLLAGRFSSQAGLRHWLVEVLKGEAGSPEVGGALFSCLKTLIREDWGQVSPILEMLAGPDHVVQSLLYEKYCSYLWPLLCAHLYQALYPGRRGVHALPALTPCTEGVRAIIQLLLRLLKSESVPERGQEQSRERGQEQSRERGQEQSRERGQEQSRERGQEQSREWGQEQSRERGQEQSREWGHVLCHQLLCTTALISWDRGMCWALGSALTDKCVMDDGERRKHSRTSAALVTVCQEVMVLLHALSSGDVFGHLGVLSRSVTFLQLCHLWLRSRSQMYVSSGSVRHLLLISHGDVPVIKAQLRRVTAVAHSMDWSSACQRLCMKLQDVAESLEGVVLGLPCLLDSVCAHQAQEAFQHMMPVGRHWRGKVTRAPDLVPSEYAEAAITFVLVPVLEGVHKLTSEEQMSAVSGAVRAFMEAWLGHILQERMRFSLQGALQLRCDFELVRELLKSPASGMSLEVVQAALSLPVFQQADNAIVCLLQQPSRKPYLQSSGCSVFCCPPLCRTTVESVSDSLQSLDSLGRRVWSHNYPAHRPRHSHDSYLPHNQRQWLSLRLHKSWTGLG